VNVGRLIGNRDQAAGNGATFERRGPVTGEVATWTPAGGVYDARTPYRISALSDEQSLFTLDFI
jgi:hypothetical protein